MNHNSETRSDIKLLKNRITEEIEGLKLLEDEIVRTIIDEIVERNEEESCPYCLHEETLTYCSCCIQIRHFL